MKKWKRAAAGLLAAGLALGMLSGCGASGGKTENAKSAEKKDDDTLTLNIVGANPNRIALVAAMREKFPELYFDVKFCVSAAGTEFINSTVRNGDASDIIHSTVPFTKEEQKEFFLDLSAYEFVNNYDSAMLQNYNNEDRIYQLPGPASLRCMMLNTTMFEEHGWKKPESYEELLEVVRQIRKDEPGITPLAMSMVTPAYPFTTITTLSQCDFLSTPDGAAWENGYLKGEGTIEDGWGQGLQMLSELIEADAFDPERYEGVWDKAAIATLADGTAAMGMIYADQKRVLELVNNEEDAYEFELLPFYGYNKGTMATGVIVNANFGLNKKLGEKGNEKKLENALKVMAWLATPEAQSYMQATIADVPSVKGAGAVEVSPYYQNLWDYTKDGYRAFMVYTGYEHLILSAGQVAYDAIMDGNPDFIDEFVEVADTTHRNMLAEDHDPAVLGSFGENFTLEESCQFVANLLQAQGLGDFSLVSLGGINENSAGNPCGISTWFYGGNVTEIQLNISLPRKTDGSLAVLSLTGAQVKKLLKEGKTSADEFDETLLSQWPYYWSGLDVEQKNGEITSIKLEGQELSDEKTYQVTVIDGDDPWTPMMGEDRPAPEDAPEIKHTEVFYLDILRKALEEDSPLMAPEVLRK